MFYTYLIQVTLSLKARYWKENGLDIGVLIYQVVSENSQEYKTPGKKEFQSSPGRQAWGLSAPYIWWNEDISVWFWRRTLHFIWFSDLTFPAVYRHQDNKHKNRINHLDVIILHICVLLGIEFKRNGDYIVEKSCYIVTHW